MTSVEYAMRRLIGNYSGTDKALADAEIEWSDAGVWGWATDGKSGLWFRGSFPHLLHIAAPDGVGKKLRPLFDMPEGKQHLPTLSVLRAFAGEAKWCEECPACKGTSKGSDYVSCSFCDGDGEVFPEVRCGWLYDRLFDLNRLACLLSPFTEDERVRLKIDKVPLRDDDAPCLYLHGQNWRAVLMAMVPQAPGLDDYEAQQSAPRFPEGIRS